MNRISARRPLTACIRVLASLLLAAAMAQAHATLEWSWDFNDLHPTVAQSGSLALHATLYNDISSGEHITAASFYARQVVLDQNLPYEESSSPEHFMDQFAGLDLAPGEWVDFVFMTLAPRNGQAPRGEYYLGNLSLVLADASGWLYGWFPDHDVYVTVVEDPDGEHGGDVPEPASVALVMGGLLGIGWVRRRAR